MSQEGGEPPEWFTDLPESAQMALIAIGFPKSWAPSGFSYAPEWVQQWQQAAWLGWAAPASLAPFYASTMYRTAMRAGWLGDQGMYGYMGRAEEAAGRAQDYMTRAAEGQGPTPYVLSQVSLWQARQAYWQTQQQWAPVAEAWGAARLTSFMFPQFGLLRAFGFPFYAAAQRLTTAAVMAPYTRQAIAQDPTALYRMEQSSMFWPGRYETLAASLIGGVGEWTAAQSIVWAIRGGKFNLTDITASFKSTAAIQLMQAGLSLMVDPLSAMVGRAIMGLPWLPTSQQGQIEMGAQMGVGAGLFGAGILAGRAWGFVPNIFAEALTPSTMGLWGSFIRPSPYPGFAQISYLDQYSNLQARLRSISTGRFASLSEAQTAMRWAALGRVTGSIIGGQIGFELGAGLGTAYVDALARQGRDVGLARMIVPPIAGTAGLMIGSWAGAKIATLAGGAGALPLIAAYGTYKILDILTEPTAAVQQYQTPMQARYALGPAAFTWTIPTAQDIGAGMTQFGQDVWSYLQGMGEQVGRTPGMGELAQRGGRGITVADIFAGYQAAPEKWAYAMGRVPGFGTWGGQATFQDWVMSEYAYSRTWAQTGIQYWERPDWQMRQYALNRAGALGLTWDWKQKQTGNYFGAYPTEGIGNWILFQSGNMVPGQKPGGPDWWASRSYQPPFSLIPQYQAATAWPRIGGAYVSQPAWQMPYIQHGYLARVGPGGGWADPSRPWTMPSNTVLYAAAQGARLGGPGAVNVQGAEAGWAVPLSMRIGDAAWGPGQFWDLPASLRGQYYPGWEFTWLSRPAGTREQWRYDPTLDKWTSTMVPVTAYEGYIASEVPGYGPQYTAAMGNYGPGGVIPPGYIPDDPTWGGQWSTTTGHYDPTTGLVIWTPPLGRDRRGGRGGGSKLSYPWGWHPGGYSSWTRPWTGIPLQIEYQRWGDEDAYGYEEAEGVSEWQVRQWVYAAISDFASTGIIMPGPMSWDDQLADAVMRRISPLLSTSLYDEGNR